MKFLANPENRDTQGTEILSASIRCLSLQVFRNYDHKYLIDLCIHVVKSTVIPFVYC